MKKAFRKEDREKLQQAIDLLSEVFDERNEALDWARWKLCESTQSQSKIEAREEKLDEIETHLQDIAEMIDNLNDLLND